ncbi:MAG: hypothetical protein HOC71_16240 [Candidatus Latescibacteria bacterium]|jgi:hypothetical protein|nr:hypothetical protein [Candidatus Latescibacterota bacterium]
MDIGKISFSGEHEDFSDRRLGSHEISDGEAKFSNDLSRLTLFAVMLLCAIFGYNYNSRRNIPINVITRSAERSLKKTFDASFEGSTTMKGIYLGIYRSRQNYSPGDGLTITPVDGENVEEDYPPPPFNTLTALEALRYASEVVDRGKEDMYNFGTRHFSGTLRMPDDDESIAYAFEYWVDIRKLRPVRFTISKIERNVGVDTNGESISKLTYINIRYYNWQK